MKARSLTPEGRWILPLLKGLGGDGITGVAVKCVEIGRNTSGEGGLLELA